MKRRIAALLMVVGFMLATAAPAAFAQGTGKCDPQPGQAEKSRSPQAAPPGARPGDMHSDHSGGAHDTNSGLTGRGERCQGLA
jgi:hypothetical protein